MKYGMLEIMKFSMESICVKIIKVQSHYMAKNTSRKSSLSNKATSLKRDRTLPLSAALIERDSGPGLGLVITDRYLESHRLCYAISLRGKLFSFMAHSVQLVLPN